MRDIGRLRPTITTAYELGYNGLVSKRFRLAADIYYEKKTDFVGPLIVESPTAHFAAAQLQQYLGARGYTPQQLAVLIPLIAGTPIGVAVPDNQLTLAPELVLTYRNFGDLKRWGADAAFEVIATDQVSVNGSYSWVNKNFFPRSEVGGLSDIALNAPANKASLGVVYREQPTGLTADVRGRWIEGFPMNSGEFVGHVDSYAIADATLAYRLPFAENTIVSLNVQNLFDKRHQEFVGAPELGRLILSQVQVTF